MVGPHDTWENLGLIGPDVSKNTVVDPFNEELSTLDLFGPKGLCLKALMPFRLARLTVLIKPTHSGLDLRPKSKTRCAKAIGRNCAIWVIAFSHPC